MRFASTYALYLRAAVVILACSRGGAKIVGERSFLLRALHEHRDRRPNAAADEDDESLFLVAKKNGEATAGRSYSTDVHFDNGLAHTASLYSPSRQDPNCSPHRWRIW